MPDDIYLNGNPYGDTSFQGQSYADADTGFLACLTDMVAHCEGIFRASSTSTLTVGASSISLVCDRNRPFSAYSWVRVQAKANPAIYMEGQVSTYDPSTGALTMTVAAGDSAGAGTLSAWDIYTTGRRGRDGNAGTAATNTVAGVVALASQAEFDARVAAKAVTADLLATGTGLKGTDIASASTLTLPPTGDYFHVTGTTGIGAISARPAGRLIGLRFAGAVTLTHNATSLILSGGASITTKADDTLFLVSEGGGNWRQIGGALPASQAEFDARTSAAKSVVPANLMTGTGLKGTDIASAWTMTLPPTGDYFHVTGTADISAISARQAGRLLALRFAGALTLANSSNLLLPGGGNIVTTADATAILASEGAGVWRVVSYLPGAPAGNPGLSLISRQVISSAVAQIDFTSVFTSSYYDTYRIVFSLVMGSASQLCFRVGNGSIGTSNYYWVYSDLYSAGTSPGFAKGQNDDRVYLMPGTGSISTSPVFGEIVIDRPLLSIQRSIRWDIAYALSASSDVARVSGASTSGGAPIDRIRIFPFSGNITSGFVSIYGMRNVQ